MAVCRSQNRSHRHGCQAPFCNGTKRSADNITLYLYNISEDAAVFKRKYTSLRFLMLVSKIYWYRKYRWENTHKSAACISVTCTNAVFQARAKSVLPSGYESKLESSWKRSAEEAGASSAGSCTGHRHGSSPNLLQVQGFSPKFLIPFALISPWNGLCTLFFLCLWLFAGDTNNGRCRIHILQRP